MFVLQQEELEKETKVVCCCRCFFLVFLIAAVLDCFGSNVFLDCLEVKCRPWNDRLPYEAIQNPSVWWKHCFCNRRTGRPSFGCNRERNLGAFCAAVGNTRKPLCWCCQHKPTKHQNSTSTTTARCCCRLHKYNAVFAKERNEEKCIDRSYVCP